MGNTLTPMRVDENKVVPVVLDGSEENQLFVKTLTGVTITLSGVEGNHSIKQVKEALHNKLQLNPEQSKRATGGCNSHPVHQRLIYAGKQLADDLTLSDYNIRGGKSLHVIFRMPWFPIADTSMHLPPSPTRQSRGVFSLLSSFVFRNSDEQGEEDPPHHWFHDVAYDQDVIHSTTEPVVTEFLEKMCSLPLVKRVLVWDSDGSYLIELKGAPASLYEGGTYFIKLSIRIEDSKPHAKMRLLTPLFHPRVYAPWDTSITDYASIEEKAQHDKVIPICGSIGIIDLQTLSDNELDAVLQSLTTLSDEMSDRCPMNTNTTWDERWPIHYWEEDPERARRVAVAVCSIWAQGKWAPQYHFVCSGPFKQETMAFLLSMQRLRMPLPTELVHHILYFLSLSHHLYLPAYLKD